MSKKNKVEKYAVKSNIKASPAERANMTPEFFSGMQQIAASSMSNQMTQPTTLLLSNKDKLFTIDYHGLDKTYVTHGVVKRFIDMPVDDGYRGWVDVEIDDLTEEEIAKVQHYVKKINFPKKFKQALKWNRLFGGSTLIVDTGASNAGKDLNIDRINEGVFLDFIPTDNWEIGQTSQDQTYFASKIGTQGDFDAAKYYYYGQEIPASRVIKFKGLAAPSLSQKQLRGWGMSEVETIIRSFSQNIKNNNVLSELLDEAKIDVFGIEGLNDGMLSASKDTRDTTIKRVQLVNEGKSYLQALVMDKEDTFEQKQVDVKGVAEVLRVVHENIAADLGFPITKLFGISSAGFSSGEEDLENYNAMVESNVRGVAEQQLIFCYKLITKKVLGIVPESVVIKYKALRTLSAEQEQKVKDQQLNRLITLRNSGFVSDEKFVDAVNSDSLLPVRIDLKDLNGVADIRELASEEGADDEG